MPPSKTLRLAVSQSRTLTTLSETLSSLAETTRLAASKSVDLILFPEAYLGGYPRSCSFGASIGSRTDDGREQYLQYFQAAVDLGDTPTGAGEDWIERKLPVAKGKEYRGDGTREFLERLARETGVFIVTGLVEKAGGTLYCSVVYVEPARGVLGKRRKVMPTGSERLVWGQGSPATLKAVTSLIRGVRVTMAAAICWENMMPLLRYSLYSQNVNLWLAPTADARDTWESLMRTVGMEGRCFVLSGISCVKKKNLPAWVDSAHAVPAATNTSSSPPASPSTGRRRRSTYTIKATDHQLVLPTMDETSSSNHQQVFDSENAIASTPTAKTTTANGTYFSDAAAEEYACRGGSCICSPFGKTLTGPLWEVEDGGLLIHDADFEDCERGRLDLDVAGSYSRNDAFKLSVEGLDLDPPPW